MLKKELNKMKLKKIKIWKIVEEAFKKEYGYDINEYISYDVIKFLVKCIEKEKER